MGTTSASRQELRRSAGSKLSSGNISVTAIASVARSTIAIRPNSTRTVGTEVSVACDPLEGIGDVRRT